MSKFFFTVFFLIVSFILKCQPMNNYSFNRNSSLSSMDSSSLYMEKLRFLGVFRVDTFVILTNFNPFHLFKNDSILTIYIDTSKQLLYFFSSQYSYDFFKIIKNDDNLMEIESCMRGISKKVSFFNDHAFSYLLFKEPEKILIYKKTTPENILYFRLNRLE